MTNSTILIVMNRIDLDTQVTGTFHASIRFDGWQATIRGDQEVRQALRKTLYVQFKIRDNDVFEKRGLVTRQVRE